MATISPVTAGLAIGSGFVVLFAAIFPMAENIIVAQNSFAITIDGLKDSYSAEEAIDFTVKVKGYGRGCGYPNVTIKNAASGAIVWTATRLLDVLCDPDDHGINIVWKPEEWGKYPIMIDEPGSYFVEAEFGGKRLVQEFAVTST